MNRFNYGNVATNAMQTMSVSAFTASNVKRSLADASKSLNNKPLSNVQKTANRLGISEEEASLVEQAKGEKAIAKAKQWKEQTSPEQHLSLGEQTEIAKVKAQDIRKKYLERDKENEVQTIDDVLAGVPSMEDNSDQMPELKTNIENKVKAISNLKKKRNKREVMF